jgi:hypothetical protein
MEEEFTYFNDEWNLKNLKFRRSNNFVKYQQIYDITLDKINKLLENNYKNEKFQNQTFLPIEYKQIKPEHITKYDKNKIQQQILKEINDSKRTK